MVAAAVRAAARFNVRPLLPGPEDALRDTVVRLGVAAQRLPVLADHAVVEALALEGLPPDLTQLLHQVVRERGGEVLSSADGTRAVVMASLSLAGALGGLLEAHGGDAAELGGAIGNTLVARGAPPAPLVARGHRLEFGHRTLVMGILNVTPDSFSGDGLSGDVRAACRIASEMAENGADIIDVGGESTRPNSAAVSAGEERSRVLPVIEALARSLPLPISVDTRKAEVARAALDAGAAIVNDVWGLRGDPEMAPVVAASDDVGVIVMHNQRGVEYSDLMRDVAFALRQSLVVAADAGIDPARVFIDPGFGFAKTPAHNLELTRRLGELRGIGRAILIGPSRKSTIGLLTGDAGAAQRLEGSLVLAALAIAGGANIVRVHDVAETVRAVRVADAVVRGTPDSVRDLPASGPTG